MHISHHRINLFGQHLAGDFAGSLASTLQRGDTLLVMAGGVVSALIDQNSHAALVATVAAAATLAFQRVEAFQLSEMLGESALSRKIIDTTPENNMAPNLDRYGLPALELADRYQKEAVILSGAAIVVAPFASAILGPVAGGLSAIAVLAPVVYRAAVGALRWNHVASGDYLITNNKQPPASLDCG